MKNPKIKELAYTVSIIGALAGLLIVVITAHSLFPAVMFRSIVVALVVLIVIVNGYGVFGESLINFLKKLVLARKHLALTKKYFVDFDKLIDRFGQLIIVNHCDTIPYVLNDLQNTGKYPNILPWPQDFTSAFDVFNEARGKLPRTKENFSLLVKWFESIVDICNGHLISKPVERIRTMGRDGIPEHIRENYARCKAIYDRFMDDYMDFAKGMNKQFAERVARVYFQVPKEL